MGPAKPHHAVVTVTHQSLHVVTLITKIQAAVCGCCSGRSCYCFNVHAVALTLMSASRYTDQDYDAEFVTVLQQQCYQYIKQAGDPSLQDISNFIHDKVEMLAITPW